MKKQSYQIDMLNGSLAGKILLFAIPVMASILLQTLFTTADTIVVGRFAGKEALAAVGSCTPLINLFISCSVGSNVAAARALGTGKREEVRSCVHTSVTFALICGVFLLLFGILFSRQMLEWMSSPPDVIELSAVYLRIYFLGVPASMLYNFGAALLRAQGDTRRPLYFLTLSGVTNVLLNLLFVVGFHMSVAGVALATVISQYLSAVLVLRCLMHGEDPMRLNLRELRLYWRTLRSILHVGLPAGLQSVLFAVANVTIQSAINSFGSSVVAGSSTAESLEGFIVSGMNAIYQAELTFSSQNYSAGQCKRVDKILALCLAYSCAANLVLGNLAVLFGHPLASIYVPGEEEVIQQAIVRMTYVSSPCFLWAIMMMFTGVLQGMGYSVIPMIATLIGSCLFRLLWIIFVFPQFGTPAALYIVWPASWVVTSLLLCIVFFCVRKRAYALVTR